MLNIFLRAIDEPQTCIPVPSSHMDAFINQMSVHLSTDDYAYFDQ